MDKSLGGMITILAICYIIEELIFIILVSLIGAILAGYGIYQLIKIYMLPGLKKSTNKKRIKKNYYLCQ